MIRIWGGKRRRKERRLDMWGENVADRTHFNKMVMTIVFLVRSAERYARKKWRHLCDLSIDNTAVELELQVCCSAATFFLVEMLQVHYDCWGFGKWYISFFPCHLPLVRSAVVAGQWLCWISLLSYSVPKAMLNTDTHTHTYRWGVAISFVRASSSHYF